MTAASRFPGPTEVQSLLFDRNHFGVAEAKAWARAHAFRYGKADEKENTIRLRQWDPAEAIDGSFRTIRITDGVQAVVAVKESRRGDWKRYRGLRKAARSPTDWTAAEVALVAADVLAPDPVPGVPGPVAAAVIAEHGLRRAGRSHVGGEPDGDRYFDPRALVQARETAENAKSRTTLVYMDPHDFLRMAEPGYDERKAEGVEAALAAGERFSDVPHLWTESREGDGAMHVVSHEGRHRARALAARGVIAMPVRLTDRNIRWGTAHDRTDRFDYVDVFPHTLVGEKENRRHSIPLPESVTFPHRHRHRTQRQRLSPDRTGAFDALAAEYARLEHWSMGNGDFRAWGEAHGLTFLGSGSARTVYAVPEGALKLAWPGAPDNTLEAQVWREAPEHLRAYLVPVLAHAMDGRWLLMERVEPMGKVRPMPTVPREIRDALGRCGVADVTNPYNMAADGRALDYANVRLDKLAECAKRLSPAAGAAPAPAGRFLRAARSLVAAGAPATEIFDRVLAVAETADPPLARWMAARRVLLLGVIEEVLAEKKAAGAFAAAFPGTARVHAELRAMMDASPVDWLAFSAALDAHARFEDEVLFPHLRAQGATPSMQAAMRHATAEHPILGAGVAVEGVAVLGAIRKHFDEEERDLFGPAAAMGLGDPPTDAAPAGRAFFVSARKDGNSGEGVLLLGPYNTHAAAEADVARGRKLVYHFFGADPHASFAGFGTAQAPRDAVTVFTMPGDMNPAWEARGAGRPAETPVAVDGGLPEVADISELGLSKDSPVGDLLAAAQPRVDEVFTRLFGAGGLQAATGAGGYRDAAWALYGAVAVSGWLARRGYDTKAYPGFIPDAWNRWSGKRASVLPDPFGIPDADWNKGTHFRDVGKSEGMLASVLDQQAPDFRPWHVEAEKTAALGDWKVTIRSLAKGEPAGSGAREPGAPIAHGQGHGKTRTAAMREAVESRGLASAVWKRRLHRYLAEGEDPTGKLKAALAPALQLPPAATDESGPTPAAAPLRPLGVVDTAASDIVTVDSDDVRWAWLWPTNGRTYLFGAWSVATSDYGRALDVAKDAPGVTGDAAARKRALKLATDLREVAGSIPKGSPAASGLDKLIAETGLASRSAILAVIATEHDGGSARGRVQLGSGSLTVKEVAGIMWAADRIRNGSGAEFRDAVAEMGTGNAPDVNIPGGQDSYPHGVDKPVDSGKLAFLVSVRTRSSGGATTGGIDSPESTLDEARTVLANELASRTARKHEIIEAGIYERGPRGEKGALVERPPAVTDVPAPEGWAGREAYWTEYGKAPAGVEGPKTPRRRFFWTRNGVSVYLDWPGSEDVSGGQFRVSVIHNGHEHVPPGPALRTFEAAAAHAATVMGSFLTQTPVPGTDVRRDLFATLDVITAPDGWRRAWIRSDLPDETDPRKVLLAVAGKPISAWTINAASGADPAELRTALRRVVESALASGATGASGIAAWRDPIFRRFSVNTKMGHEVAFHGPAPEAPTAAVPPEGYTTTGTVHPPSREYDAAKAGADRFDRPLVDALGRIARKVGEAGADTYYWQSAGSSANVSKEATAEIEARTNLLLSRMGGDLVPNAVRLFFRARSVERIDERGISVVGYPHVTLPAGTGIVRNLGVTPGPIGAWLAVERDGIPGVLWQYKLADVVLPNGRWAGTSPRYDNPVDAGVAHAAWAAVEAEQKRKAEHAATFPVLPTGREAPTYWKLLPSQRAQGEFWNAPKIADVLTAPGPYGGPREVPAHWLWDTPVRLVKEGMGDKAQVHRVDLAGIADEHLKWQTTPRAKEVRAAVERARLKAQPTRAGAFPGSESAPGGPWGDLPASQRNGTFYRIARVNGATRSPLETPTQWYAKSGNAERVWLAVDPAPDATAIVEIYTWTNGVVTQAQGQAWVAPAAPAAPASAPPPDGAPQAWPLRATEEYTAAIAKLMQRLKKTAGVSTIRQNYKGTGSEVARRQLWINWQDGGVMDVWLDHTGVNFGGVVIRSPEGRQSHAPRGFKYGGRSPEQVYEGIERELSLWSGLLTPEKADELRARWIAQAPAPAPPAATPQQPPDPPRAAPMPAEPKPARAPTSGCIDVTFELPGRGTVRVACDQSGQRDVWHNIHVGGVRYGYNGRRWARSTTPPADVLDAVRSRGITAFE